MSFNEWPSIESFHRVRKDVQMREQKAASESSDTSTRAANALAIEYRCKIKLHGTNSGIILLPNGQCIAQSRNRILSVGAADNMGFAKWVSEEVKPDWVLALLDKLSTMLHGVSTELPVSHMEQALQVVKAVAGADGGDATDALKSPQHDVLCDEDHLSSKQVTLFGEWCGKGIANKVAVSLLPEKLFAVFAIQIGKSSDPNAHVIIDPDLIASLVDTVPLPADADGNTSASASATAIATATKDAAVKPASLFVLPWHDEEHEVAFSSQESLAAFTEYVERRVEEVDAQDPWVRTVFGVEGAGEGVVCYPTSLQTTWTANASDAGDLTSETTFPGAESASCVSRTAATADDNSEGDAGVAPGERWQPIAPFRIIKRRILRQFMFKAKGESHKVVRHRGKAGKDPGLAAEESVVLFLDSVLSPARMEQGVREVVAAVTASEAMAGGVPSDRAISIDTTAAQAQWQQQRQQQLSHRDVAKLINWVAEDVKKDIRNREVDLPECLRQEGVDGWKIISKELSIRVRKWFFAYLERL